MSMLRTILYLLLATFCFCSQPLRAADEKKATPALLNQKDLPAKYREAAESVAAALVAEKEEPREFKAEVEEKEGRAYVFHLWHISAFASENKGAIGNPGGKCRDIVYDLKSHKSSKSLFWQ